MNWIFYLFTSILTLLIFHEYPLAATLLASLIMCHYVGRKIATPLSRFAILYPFLCFWLSQQFSVYNFFEIGDGPAYFAVMNDILPRLDIGNYQGFLAFMAFVGPKYLNLGFVPTAVLPDLLFDIPDSITYQLTQAYVHVTLVSLLLALVYRWNSFNEQYRSAIFLFMLLSPGYLALITYPTRHHFTSFGVFLLFIGFEACLVKRSAGRILAFLIAILIVFFCKAGLLPFFLMYALFRTYQPQRIFLNILLGSFLVSLVAFVYQLVTSLYDLQFAAETIGVFKDASLGPLIPLYKYVMALVSPFPYYKYSVVVDTVAYGGNWWLLLLFIPAGVIGLWLFCRVLLNPVKLWRYDRDTRRLFAYGGSMSLSVLGGSTGFLMYILICLPFFAPLFHIQEYNVPISVVLLTLLILNVVVMFLNGENLLDYL